MDEPLSRGDSRELAPFDRIAEAAPDATNLRLAADAEENLTATWTEGGQDRSYCISKDRSRIEPCTPGPSTIQVSIEPATAALSAFGRQRFEAAVTGYSDSGYTWSLSLGPGAPPGAQTGQIYESGSYEAPVADGVPSAFQVLVTATSVANPAKSATAIVSLTPPPAAPAPSFDPPPGAYAQEQSVTLTCSTPYCQVFYTIGGDDPRPRESRLYTRPIVTPETRTLKAIATGSGMANSPVVTGEYVIGGRAARPWIAPRPGIYHSSQTISLTSSQPAASIRYTIDGQDPTSAAGIVYTSPFTLDDSAWVRAVASVAGLETSGERAVKYTIQPAEPLLTPRFDPPPGTYATPQQVYILGSTSEATTRYTTDGSEPTLTYGTLWDSRALPIATTITLKAIQYGIPGSLPSAVGTGTFVIGGPQDPDVTVTAYRVLFGSQSFSLPSARNRLPWQITGIQIVFSSPIASGDVSSLTGVTATELSGLGTDTLTWTISPLIEGDYPTALVTTGSHALASASGAPIQPFTQNVKTLYGDFNDDGYVAINDAIGVRNAMSGPYNIFADMDGSGVVDLTDVTIVRTRGGATLP